MTLALIGIVIGLLVAFALTRWMETLLFGVRPIDPLTFTVITSVLALVGYSRDTCLSQIWDKHVYPMNRVMPHLKFFIHPNHQRPER
jgi:uncharacterized protein YacL